MSDEVELYFKTALTIVKNAGRLVYDAFSQPISIVQTKTSNIDLVTETDRAVEEYLISELTKSFPDHKFIGEESAAEGKKYVLTDSPTWIIDPIDGTTNFVHRIPLIAICVGLTVRKKLVAGIVYNPITEELFSAQLGKGAFKNGFPINVSATKSLEKAVITTTLGVHNITEKGIGWLDVAMENQRKIVLSGIRGSRAFGSAAINIVFVAQGSVDAYVEYGLHSWDMAAAAIILAEAGGVVLDPTGTEFNVMSRKILCASSTELATELSGLLTHVDFEPEA